ncbi:MAG TPA: universal stress protein [Conexibacter sp.]|nr:universal stress protein [Conexibacter sp.]
MFSTIVAGFDDSPRARDGLALAQLLARICRAELIAADVYVFHPIHRMGDSEWEQYLREEALEQMSAARELARGAAPRLLALAGQSVPEALQRLALSLPADLLVIGSRRRGAAARALSGSTSERLLQGAPCPVAIAPPGYAQGGSHRLRTLGVGFDGGRESLVALDAAVEIAQAADARLQVITVCPPRAASTRLLHAKRDLSAYLTAVREQRAERQAAAVAAIDAVDTTGEMRDGDAAAVLIARARELDLLVLGSRGYGPWRRLMLGSVSTKVTRKAACPLLLVPRAALPEDDRSEERW